MPASAIYSRVSMDGSRYAPLAATAAAVALVAAARALTFSLDAHPDLHIGNPPLVGSIDWRPSLRLAPAVLLAIAAVALAPLAAVRLRWRVLLATSALAAFAWAVTLALGDGIQALVAPLMTRYEYLAAVDSVDSPGAFLDGFVERLATYPTHVKSHPPGLLLALWGLDEVGLGGAWPMAALVIGTGALAAPAALVCAREIAGEATARQAAPFLAFAPAALWVATSADGLFLGVTTIGIAAFVLATGRRGLRGDAFALAAGLVLGVALALSYGVAALAIVVLAVAVHRRRLRPLIVATTGVAVVGAALLAGGFVWWDGLAATREQYYAGLASQRPFAAFLVISVAAFAVALGPAVAGGLATLRDRRLWVLVGAGIATVLAADVSGLSRGETERIWLPFTPWLLLACAPLANSIRGARGWLALQVVVALTLQAAIVSPW